MNPTEERTAEARAPRTDSSGGLREPPGPPGSTTPVDLAALALTDPGAAAGLATERILAATMSGAHRGVVVDSPPGAGKSTLVVRAARELAAAGRPLMVIAQTNAQVDDLVLRLAAKDPASASAGCTAATPTRTTAPWTNFRPFVPRRRPPIWQAWTW